MKKLYKDSSLKKLRDKHKRVEVYLTHDEYAKFLEKSELCWYGNKVWKLIKKFSLAYENNIFIYPPELKKTVDELYYAIKKSADNINKIAHFYNSKGYLLDEQKMFDCHKKMQNDIEKFINNKFNYDYKINAEKG